MQYLDRAHSGKNDAIFLYTSDVAELKAGMSFQQRVGDMFFELRMDDEVSDDPVRVVVGVPSSPGDPYYFGFMLSEAAIDVLRDGRMTMKVIDPAIPADHMPPTIEIYLLPDHATDDEYEGMLTKLGFK